MLGALHAGILLGSLRPLAERENHDAENDSGAGGGPRLGAQR
jgi:hypothetical protein